MPRLPATPSVPALRTSLPALVALAVASASCSDTTLIGLSGEIVVDPDHLVFDSVTLGTFETQDVRIINAGNGNLEVTDLALKVGAESLSFAGSPKLLLPDEEMTVHVTYAPLVTDEVSDALVITSADAANPVIEVPITAAGAGELVPDIYADPEEGEFGQIEIGFSATLVVEVGNAGMADLVIGDVDLVADAEFQLVDDGGLPGSTIPSVDDGGVPGTITITYTPEALEANQGVLYIYSNDPDEPEVQIPLSAEGTYPGGDGPVAVCSVDPEEAMPFETLHWYGDESYDTSGRPIVSYVWTIDEFPSGSSATLTGSGSNRTTVTDLAGTYSAELVVTNDLGQSSFPCTATAEVVPTEDLWIEMYWTHSGDDMDLHLIKPGGALETNGDCYYANCAGAWSALDWGTIGYTGDDPHLDIDDIPGTGPENINISAPSAGVYTVVVNDYPGSVYNGANETYINIYINGSLVDSFSDPMTGGEDYYWYVAEIDWPSGVVTPL